MPLSTTCRHWNTALKLNPNYAEVMVELARLEFHWPRKKIHPHFIRYDIAVPLLERCLELAPTNKMAIDGYAFILLIQSQGLRPGLDPYSEKYFPHTRTVISATCFKKIHQKLPRIRAPVYF